MDWIDQISQAYPVQGATNEQVLEAAEAAFGGFSEIEVHALAQSVGIDVSAAIQAISQWDMGSCVLPDDYVKFLRYSYGGSFYSGDRAFDPVLTAGEIRDCMVGSGYPIYYRGCVPIAYDGSGHVFALSYGKDGTFTGYEYVAYPGEAGRVALGKSLREVMLDERDPFELLNGI